MTTYESQSRGIVFMLLAQLAFSVMGALVKHAVVSYPPMEVVFFRASLNLIFLLPIMFYKRIAFLGSQRRMLFTRSVTGFLALSLCFYATSKIKLADASILNATSVMFVALLSVSVLREKITPALAGSIAIAFVGAVLVIKPEFNVANVPGLAGLMSGFFAALAYISIKQLLGKEAPDTIVFNFSLYSCVLSLLLFGADFKLPYWSDLPVILGVGISGTIGQVFMTRAYSFGPASVISPFSFAGVMFSAIWGALIWAELPDTLSILGAILIVISGVQIMRENR